MKIISLLGNKASLQEEVNRKLGQNPQLMKLTKYSKIASYDKVLGQDYAVKNIFFLDTQIKPASESNAYP